jgi:hypothetical protein
MRNVQWLDGTAPARELALEGAELAYRLNYPLQDFHFWITSASGRGKMDRVAMIAGMARRELSSNAHALGDEDRAALDAVYLAAASILDLFGMTEL